jgi:hypothetical protein
MSDENSVTEQVENVATPEPKTNAASGGLAGFMALKEKNAKAFYGIIGGAGLLILFLLMPSGHDATLPSSAPKNLAAGQKYTLKSPNVDAENIAHSTVRLVSTPGAIAAFDDDENKTEECRKFPVGTHVTVIDKQNISTVSYAKVQIEEEGECNGTIGWVLSINL